MRILLVEDETELAGPLAELLRQECFSVDIATDGSTADELKFVNSYDLVVLDWSIPAPTGIELLRQWRESGDETPVLMLTGRRAIEDRVSGLDSGADDYLVKPFSLREFMARVRGLLRRRHRPLQGELRAADVCMNRASRQVTVDNQPVELTPKEFAILEYFLRRPEEVVTRGDLIDHVWDDSFDASSNVVDVTVYRLRGKIDGNRDERILHTVKGVGYILKRQRCKR